MSVLRSFVFCLFLCQNNKQLQRHKRKAHWSPCTSWSPIKFCVYIYYSACLILILQWVLSQGINMTRYRAFLNLKNLIYDMHRKNCTHQSGHDFFLRSFRIVFDSEGYISLVPEGRLSWMRFFATYIGPFRLIPECTPNQPSSASFQTSFHYDFSDFRCGVVESFGLLTC
jgi:hypothetical protein